MHLVTSQLSKMQFSNSWTGSPGVPLIVTDRGEKEEAPAFDALGHFEEDGHAILKETTKVTLGLGATLT